MAEKRNLTTKLTIQNLTKEFKSTFAKKTEVNALATQVTTLIGEDDNKSVRKIANEELAKQLIPENAKEALNELEEIAAWIQSHPDDAATMNADIEALKTKTTLGSKGVAGFVAATGTYEEGTTYYTDNTGETQVDTSAFTAETDVSSYFVAGTVQSEYATVKQYVEAVESGLDTRLKALETVEPTKVEASETNGHIIIDGEDVTVYALPDSVLHDTDIVDYSQAEIAKMLADDTVGAPSAANGTVAAGSTTTFTISAASTTTIAVTSGDTDIATATPDAGTESGDNKTYTITVTGVAEGETTISVSNVANEYDVQTYTITVTA